MKIERGQREMGEREWTDEHLRVVIESEKVKVMKKRGREREM